MIYAVGIPDGDDWLLITVPELGGILAFDTEDEATKFAAEQGDEFMAAPYKPAPGDEYVVVA